MMRMGEKDVLEAAVGSVSASLEAIADGRWEAVLASALRSVCGHTHAGACGVCVCVCMCVYVCVCVSVYVCVCARARACV